MKQGEIKMKTIGVADPDTEIKMRPIEQRMKQTGVMNPDIEVGMNETGVADLDTGVEMKPHEQKMKPIRVRNPDVVVGMNETGVGMKPIEQILFDGFHFFAMTIEKGGFHLSSPKDLLWPESILYRYRRMESLAEQKTYRMITKST